METIFVGILWVLANAVYVDMRRRGTRGFKRLVAFWLGWPGTFVGLLSVDEASQPSLREDDEDLRELVLDIRRDRMLRGDEPEPGATAGDLVPPNGSSYQREEE